MQAGGGGHAGQTQFLQRLAGAGQGLAAIGAMGDELGQQRVVIRRHPIARIEMTVDADPRALRPGELLDRPGAGKEVARRVLGVESQLDGGALQMDVFLAQPQGFAPGDAQHGLDQIDAGDHLGDRMLDLDAGVHLDEEELAAGFVEQVFQGAGAPIAEAFGQAYRAGAEGLALGSAQDRRWRLFQELLPASLQRAFALEQMYGALAIAQDLHLYMPSALDEALQIEGAAAKGGLGFALGDGKFPRQLGGVARQADAPAASPRRCLDQQRIAHCRGCRYGCLNIGRFADGARYHRDASRQGGAPCLGLVAHATDDVTRRADEDGTGLLHRIGKGGVLGQEAIAGMHCIGAAVSQGLEQRLYIEVAAIRPRRADHHHGIGLARRQRIPIGLAAGQYRLDVQRLGGAQDTDGDLAPIGHQQPADAAPCRTHEAAPFRVASN